METFSDSVFAIAITLLVFELLVPSPQMAADKGGLGPALLSQWPVYVAFFISFLTILIIWINPHRMLHLFSAVDHTLVILNGLVLLSVFGSLAIIAGLALYSARPVRSGANHDIL